jgi:hypothetical protein
LCQATTSARHAACRRYPLIEVLVVSDERRSLYAQRFGERTQCGGWLITPARLPAPPWLLEQLATRYRVTRTVTSPGWQATY